MHKLVILIVILLVIAIILQLSAGILNMLNDGHNSFFIGSTKFTVTSEHLWWDSLFLMEGAILVAIIYSITATATATATATDTSIGKSN
jgi:nitric oxide reductase large subunit